MRRPVPTVLVVDDEWAVRLSAKDALTEAVKRVRLVGQGLASPKSVKLAAMASFAVAGLVGTALALAVGPILFVVGAVWLVIEMIQARSLTRTAVVEEPVIRDRRI